jgi:hypothetical protein
MTSSILRSVRKIRKRKLIQKWQITTLSVVTNVILLLLRGDFWRGADAAPLFNKTVVYLKARSDSFFAAASAGQPTATATNTALGVTVSALIELLPWAVILVVAGITATQAYKGYQQFEQEDLAGMSKSLVSVVVLILLVVMASYVMDFLVT